MKIKFLTFLISALLINTSVLSEEKKYGVNFYTGMFDFSDDGKKSALYGIEHQNENLFKDTIFGRITPVTGAMITQDSAAYFYTGIETNYSVGRLKITPSFTPGLYRQGDGKDLGHPLEFKSEVQLSLDLSEGTNLGMSYNHVSNASLGDKNPGANSYMFNFLKKF
jgi:lipid A 3-O-deacylase|tara:strand:- start:1055 stop:1552 length:498 start_codon:yes stop_codon:yes gene_type:complete